MLVQIKHTLVNRRVQIQLHENTLPYVARIALQKIPDMAYKTLLHKYLHNYF